MPEPLSGEERAALDAVIERDNDWDGLGIDGAVALTLAVLAAVPRLNPLVARVAELERERGELVALVRLAARHQDDITSCESMIIERLDAILSAAPPTGGTPE